MEMSLVEAELTHMRYNADPSIREFNEQLYEIFLVNSSYQDVGNGSRERVLNQQGTVLFDEKLQALNKYRSTYYPQIKFN